MNAKQATTMLAGLLIVFLGVSTCRHSNAIQRAAAAREAEDNRAAEDAAAFIKGRGIRPSGIERRNIGEDRLVITAQAPGDDGAPVVWVLRYSESPSSERVRL